MQKSPDNHSICHDLSNGHTAYSLGEYPGIHKASPTRFAYKAYQLLHLGVIQFPFIQKDGQSPSQGKQTLQ